jgi:hypothetical protein
VRLLALASVLPLSGCLLLLDAGDGIGDEEQADAGISVGDGDGGMGPGPDAAPLFTLTVLLLPQTSGVNGEITIYRPASSQLGEACTSAMETCISSSITAGTEVRLESTADVQSWNLDDPIDCLISTSNLTQLIVTVSGNCTVVPTFVDPADT